VAKPLRKTIADSTRKRHLSFLLYALPAKESDKVVVDKTALACSNQK